MTHDNYEGRDTEVQGFDRRAEDVAASPKAAELPEVERDPAGIPTFVFRDQLAESDRPSPDGRTLEVALLWRQAVMGVGHYSEPTQVTVGYNLGNTFRVATDELPGDRFTLVEARGREFVVNWTQSMRLQVRNEKGQILTEEQLDQEQRLPTLREGEYEKRQYTLGLNDRVAVQVGEVTFVIQYVSPARLSPTSLLKTIDFYFTKVLSLSILAHLFFILALLFTPYDPEGLSDDLFKNANRFAQLLLKEPEKQKLKKFDLEGSKGGGRHKDKEGQFGKPKDKKKDALASTKGAPRVDPNKREKDRKIALESGIFKALQGTKDSAVSNVFGPGGLGTGINNALGGLRGTAMGDAGGAGGLGTRGTGPGGGGNSLGIGGLGDGTGRGTGGLGNVDLGGRGKGRYAVIPGRTITKGCLSQEVVGRVLQRVHSQAKYCYEKELNRNPNLSGKITTNFLIGPTGAVVTAKIAESTMGDPPVEQCLVKVIERLRFPPCAGGGTAEVTYPWIFKSGGE